MTEIADKKAILPSTGEKIIPAERYKEEKESEMFYGRSWHEKIPEFIVIVDQYMHWYREKRIKALLGGLSPRAF